MTTTKRTMLRVDESEHPPTFVQAEVSLQEGDGPTRLSICGVSGYVLTLAAAKREALEYWRSFFDENLEEIIAMNQRFDKRFTSALGAAKFVIASDGDLHGVDVMKEEAGRVFVVSACGQIVDELREAFPEVRPYLKWHLNDMHAECVHQEARGETYAALSKAPSTRTRRVENGLGQIRDVDVPATECPDCGYSCGSAWTVRELPEDVLTWARSFGDAA